MKTPLQKLIQKWEEDAGYIRIGKIQTDAPIFQAFIDDAKAMLEKEKDVMCEFADEFSRECIDSHHAQTISTEKFYEITFNTNEK